MRSRIIFLTAIALALILGLWTLRRSSRVASPDSLPPLSGSSPTLPASSPPTPGTMLPDTPSRLRMAVFASDLRRPRVLVEDPAGTLLVSDMGAGTVLALPDEDQNGTADTKIPVLENLRSPHGLTFHDGALYVAETHAVTRYTYDPRVRRASNPTKILDLPTGGNHMTRTIGFGPDGMLYVSIGSSCNVCRERDERRAAILRVDPATGKAERWAWGLRNTVFFTFHPETGAMLGNDMGRDHLGDDLPPDELNVITGGDYGWPYCYGQRVPDPFGRHPQGCETTVPSLFDYPAHVAPLGVQFIPAAFTRAWAGDLLVAFHGSWNRSQPIGYSIVRLDIENDRVVRMEDVLTSFRTADEGVQGRPAGLLFTRNGTLYVADDRAGLVAQLIPSR